MSTLEANFQQKYVSFTSVPAHDLPASCPPKGVKNWNFHPKIYLQFDKNNQASCPYCGAKYQVDDAKK